MPAHAPLHPVKVEPLDGVAVRRTLVPPANDAVHVVPQSIPVGLDATAPEPFPASETVTENVDDVSEPLSIVVLSSLTHAVVSRSAVTKRPTAMVYHSSGRANAARS